MSVNCHLTPNASLVLSRAEKGRSGMKDTEQKREHGDEKIQKTEAVYTMTSESLHAPMVTKPHHLRCDHIVSLVLLRLYWSLLDHPGRLPHQGANLNLGVTTSPTHKRSDAIPNAVE